MSIHVKLARANLKRVKLTDAKLMRANLSDANLLDANLSDANLTGANLTGTDLTGANLSDANLTGANFAGTDLTGANFTGAKLTGTKLTNAKLTGVKFDRNNLNLLIDQYIGIKLEGINLSGTDLEGINLSRLKLKGCNLSGAKLIGVQALGTNFEDATLTGACIEDWNINSRTNLQNVKCDYIYLKAISSEEEKKYIFTERVPHDPDKIFAPGEFTKRYQKILETVNLYFGEGIDWQVFLKSFQKLQEEERIKIADGEREIPIVQGIENTGDGSFVIKIGVSPDMDKGEIEKSFWQKYQPMLEAQEEKYRLLLSAKDEQINDFRQQNTQLLEIIKLKASQPININISDRVINVLKGNYNENIQGNYFEEAAVEIQKLLEYLQQNNEVSLEQAQQQTAKDLATQAQNDPTLKERLLKLGQFISENAGKTVIGEGVKGVIKLLLFML